MSTRSEEAHEDAGTARTDETADGSDPGVSERADPDSRTGEAEGELELTNEPSRLSQILTLVAAAVGVVSTAVFSGLALPFGVVGLVLVVASVLSFQSRRWLTLGIVFIFIGLVVSAALGVLTAELVLLGTVATLLAWDAGQFGFSVAEHLGREARTKRLVIVHSAATAAFLGLMSLVAFGVFRFAGTNQPATAVAFLVFGIISLLWTFRT